MGIGEEYSGEAGWAQFYTDGRFAVEFTTGITTGISTHNPREHSVRYLEQLGIKAQLYTVAEEGDSLSMTLLETVEDMPILSCKITMVYEGGQLRAISGWRLQGAAEVDEGGEPCLLPETMLLHLVQAVAKGDIPCDTIQSITPAYVYSTGSLSSRSRLLPVWVVETSQDYIILNCQTGQMDPKPIWMRDLAPQ